MNNPIVKVLVNIIACYAMIFVTDYLFHSLILMGDYEATMHLWRPEAEMKMPLMILTTILEILIFSMAYKRLIAEKNGLRSGLHFGIVVGLIVGIALGFGTYSYQPITLKIAWVWFTASVVQFGLIGVITGLLFKPQKEA